MVASMMDNGTMVNRMALATIQIKLVKRLKASGLRERFKTGITNKVNIFH